MDQVKFFKVCLSQILLGPFLNTLFHIVNHIALITPIAANKVLTQFSSKRKQPHTVSTSTSDALLHHVYSIFYGHQRSGASTQSLMISKFSMLKVAYQLLVILIIILLCKLYCFNSYVFLLWHF